MNNSSMSNITEDFSKWEVLRVASAISIVTVGIIGNSVVFYILTRQEFLKNSFFRYVLISTCFDALNSLQTIPYTFSDFFKMKELDISCKLCFYIINLTLTMSPWMNVIISIDVFILIKYPLRFNFRKKLKFQIAICSSLFFAVCVINIPNWFYSAIVPTFGCTSPTQEISFYMNMFNMILQIIAPFILTVIFLSLSFHQLLVKKKIKNRKGEKTEKSFFKILILLNILFCLFNLPNVVAGIITNFFDFNCESIKLVETILFFLTQFSYLYFSLDIIAYSFSNKLFRKYLLSLLACFFSKKIKKNTAISNIV
jgi:hypothetical protein